MPGISIPLQITGIGAAQRQLMQLGRQASQLRLNMPIAAGGSGGSGIRVPRQPAAPKAPASLGQQIKNAVMSSRIGFGAGGFTAMPLVNRLLPIFMKLNPALVLFTGALGLAANAAKQAAESLNAFRAGQITSGGTAGQTAQLGAFGRFTGADLNEMSRAFSREISTNGIAAGYAARSGIYDPGGEIFGDTNKATNLLKWAEALRKMSGTEATRAARLTGTEELLKMRDLSESTFQKLKQTAEMQARAYSSDNVRKAAEFSAQMERLSMNFDMLKVAIGSKLLPLLTDMIDKANTLFPGLGLGDEIKKFKFGKNKQEQALQDNTDALKQMATILKNGPYGGGTNARGAIPGAYLGSGVNGYNQIMATPQNLGAIVL